MSDTTASTDVPKVAFISQGKLFVTQPGAESALVSSPFFEDMLARAERDRDRQDWKSQGMGWSLGGNRAMIPQKPEITRAITPFTAVTSGTTAGEMFYALNTGMIGAIFKADHEGERRLFHRSQFKVVDLSRHPQTQKLLFSTPSPDGTSHLGMMESTGRFFKQITEGDCRDECPSWVAGSESKILFQTAGIARNDHGMISGHSPYAISTLDLSDGKIETLVEYPDVDCLLPRMATDGTLYFLKRPYEAVPRISIWTALKDMVLFPFRLIFAIVNFLNFFSIIFSRKPLINAGGPPEAGPDSRTLMLWGKVIDAEKHLKLKGTQNGDSLVPDSWQLIRRSTDGAEKVIAKGVSCFDLDDLGSLVYANGSTVYQVTESGKTVIGTGKLIERISVIQ